MRHSRTWRHEPVVASAGRRGVDLAGHPLTGAARDRGFAALVDDFAVTGATSNPTIFNHAIQHSSAYDTPIREKFQQGKSGEDLFFDLALGDLKRAAAMFAPIHNQTNGVDGWVSLEVSPLLAHDTANSIALAKSLYARAGIPNTSSLRREEYAPAPRATLRPAAEKRSR